MSENPSRESATRRRYGAILPTLALIGVTAVWGSTFFLIKDLIQQVPPLDFLGARFGLAGVLVLIFQWSRLRRATWVQWRQGAVLAAFYSAGQLTQTIGLETTAASISGFITGMYVVFTPLVVAVLFRGKVTGKAWLAVLLATVGLAFLNVQLPLGISAGRGELLTLIGAAFYAFHIAFLGKWAKDSDPLTLGMIEVVMAGLILGIAALPGGVVLPQTTGAWASFLYMALIAGLGAIVEQTWAQSRLSATTTSVIMTTEPLFAALFAVALGGESLTAQLLVGGTLILGAMFVADS